MKATIIGFTQFTPPPHVEWLPEGWETSHLGSDFLADRAEATGQDLAEFAGRACYQSWSRPNPKTASNRGYLDHILGVGHESVLEHGTITVYIEEVSRSLTHELVRHRHFSYSQLSQRFMDESQRNAPVVIPPLFADDGYAQDLIETSHITTLNIYDDLVKRAEELLPDHVTGFNRRKQAREAARVVLENGTETKTVVTGNYRAWRHFFLLRGSLAADAEIRGLAVMLFDMISRHYSCDNVFQDMVVGYEHGQQYIAKK